MTDEHKVVLLAAKRAAAVAKAEGRENRIKVGAFEVYRFDTENWCIYCPKRGDEAEEFWYYPTLDWALKALLSKRIGDTNHKNIAGIMAAVKSAEQEILAALSRKEANPTLSDTVQPF